jgi:hypothetical protein
MDTCPCCGYRTIVEEYDICEICRWEHDLAQERRPDSDAGANRVSLRQGQKNFPLFGAADPSLRAHAKSPGTQHVRDPQWRPLD